MARFSASLRDETRRLMHLQGDLSASANNGVSWDATVPAPRTLGSELVIENWYLAMHFLNVWNEWDGMLCRYLRYFGQTAQEIPASWARLKRDCVEVEQRLQPDSGLDERVADSWSGAAEIETAREIDAGDLFQEIVASHARLAFLRHYDSHQSAPVWRRSTAVAWESDHQVKQQLARLPAESREPLAWHLRHYRHAMLDVSWLDEPRWSEADESRRTAFEQVLGRPLPPPPWVGDFVQTLADRGPPAECVGRVLGRMTRAVAEIGYESFFDDVTSAEMRGGPDSPLGDDAVRLIRKDTPATDLAAARIVVGVARGSAK